MREHLQVLVAIGIAASAGTLVTCVGEVGDVSQDPGSLGGRAGATGGTSSTATGAGTTTGAGGDPSAGTGGASTSTGMGGSGGVPPSGGGGGQATGGSGVGSSGASGMGGGPGTGGSGGGSGSKSDAGMGGGVIDASFDAPPPTNGTDDWPAFGHDTGRSFVSTDAVTPPLSTTVWTWTNAGTQMTTLRNVVSAAGKVHLHGIGNGPHEHTPDANNPFLQTIDFQTGASIGIWSIDNDFPNGDWYAATADRVVVNDDSLSIVDLGTFKARTAARVGNICQLGDSDGEVAIDAANNRFFAFNRNQYHDPDDFGPGFCIPPGNISAYNLATGAVLWSKNHTQYPVNSTAFMSYAAGIVYFSTNYTGGTAPESGLYAFDGATGEQKWFQKNPMGTTYGASSTDGKTLHVVAITGGALTIKAFDAATGTPGWTSASLGTVQSLGRGFEADPPAYLGGTLFVYTGKTLVALDRSTGAQRWSVPNLTGLVAQNGNHLAISSASGVVFLTDATALRAFKADDGSPVWNQPITTVGKLGSLILVRGRALVFGASGIVMLGSP